MKLTKAQGAVLEAGKPIYYRPITRRAHYIATGGFAIKVNIATFDALVDRGFIRCDRSPGQVAQEWVITDAGRRALTSGDR